jgi:pyruvate/2-oxoglutarate dehydrogenase complex dihydrolipoamide dehydrogenase (E3) component
MAEAGNDTWDVIVIGAGPPGENAALYASNGGLSAALVEAELVGGECSYWACMPSKALLRSVEVRSAAAADPGSGHDGEIPIDHLAVLARRDAFVKHHDESSQIDWAGAAGIDVVRGRGRIDGKRTVVVDQPGGAFRSLRARHAVVLATGTTAAIPDIPGLAGAHPWTSRDVTNCHEIPPRVAILGGGVVACEAATWLLGLGAQEVTVIGRGGRLLSRAEPFAGELVRERLEASGARILLNTDVTGVRRGAVQRFEPGWMRGVEATVVMNDREIIVDEVVVAAGRTPATSDLGLDTVGLPPGGYVTTDDHMAVKGLDGAWLYAVGDVTGRALLTHMGKYQARLCGDVIAARANNTSLDSSRYRDIADHGQVPQVTFTDPQIASVGLTQAEAERQEGPVAAVEQDLAQIAGASLLRDDYVGRAKLVVDPATETLLGATFVGSDVAELLHSATVAIVGRVPLDVLWHAVPSYPTISEVWLRLLEAWRAR